ncbi:MAG: DUF5011 domain-containing protein, partial [Deltaproteobacteria bacterium]|nr:DUF5011 domain-containing protein [Deltaproteobacteria bacterium]
DNVDATVSVVVTANTVNVSAVGSYTVTYSATDTAGNIATATRTVNVVAHFADLEVVNSATSQFVDAGGSIGFIITVTNHGPGNAENVVVTDDTPGIDTPEFSLDGITWNSWSGLVNLGFLNSGDSIQFELRGMVAANASGVISNTAFVDSELDDSNSGNNSSLQQTLVRAENVPPEAVSPERGAIIAPDTYPVALESSPFVDTDGHTHLATYWRVRRSDMDYGHAGSDESFAAEVTSGDMTHHDITGGLLEGLEYMWQVGFLDSGSDRIFWSEESSFLVGYKNTSDTRTVKAGTGISSYAMVSIDYYPENNTCVSVFDLADVDSSGYRIGTYDPLTGTYLECGDDLRVKPGRSYWVLARHGLDVTVQGVPVSTDVDIEVKLQYGDNGNGWNMIGVPNGRDYFWDDIQVIQYDDDGALLTKDPLSVESAASRGLINPNVWIWDDGVYARHLPGESPMFKLVHREGFWVKALQKGVALRFVAGAPRPVVSSGMGQLIASLDKTATAWLDKWFFAKTANADAGDSPPLPMEGLDLSGGASDGGGGCFITTVKFNGSK